MKKTLVIVGHPDLDRGSLANKIVVDRLADVDGVNVRNLARLYPDFAIDIEAEQQALLAADTIVFQFPFYWYSVPGILKEWVDRVLSYGFAYGSSGDKLRGKRFILSTTIGGPAESYGSGHYNTYTIDDLLKPWKQTCNLTGMHWQEPVLTHGMVYIPGVYNVKEEVEERARGHAQRLLDAIAGQPQTT
ncbi:MAG: NAD(P)H-dependent oxidoreductase [Candidatus Krumholzibacteriia bacterium]